MALATPTFRPSSVEAEELRPAATVHEIAVTNPSHVAFVILRFGFMALPIIAGLDKFFDFLVNWDQYLSAPFAALLGGNVHMIMMGVGIIEIIAGIVVGLMPQIGAYLVMAWLWGIIVNLILIPGYFDVALRDFGLSLGALALAYLSRAYSRR